MQDNQTSSKKVLVIRIIKISVFMLALCAFMCLSLKWHLGAVADHITYLENEKRPNTVWLVQYGSVLLPTLTMAIFLTVAYKIGNSYLPVKTQRDKTIIIIGVCIFTYAVLFAEICRRSEGWMLPPADGAEDVESLLERSVIWFCVQAFCFLIMVSYHLIKASSEKRELEDASLRGDESEVNENDG